MVIFWIILSKGLRRFINAIEMEIIKHYFRKENVSELIFNIVRKIANDKEVTETKALNRE